MKWLFLTLAIIAEVIATSALKTSHGFTKIMPSIIVVIGYAIAFYFLSITLKYLPIGIIYAVWSGMGIVLIALIGYFVFKQRLDMPAIIGICLIVTGVIFINLFSKTLLN